MAFRSRNHYAAFVVESRPWAPASLLLATALLGCVSPSPEPGAVDDACASDDQCETGSACFDGHCLADGPHEPPQQPVTGGGEATRLPPNECVRLPLDNYNPYGWQSLDSRGYHHAEDASAAPGTPVYAVANGTISYVVERLPRSERPSNWGGLLYQNVAVGGERATVMYGHVDPTRFRVRVGDVVARGALIGYVASEAQTGFPPPHLHVQVGPSGSYQPAAMVAGYGPTMGAWQSFTSWANRLARSPGCASPSLPLPTLRSPAAGAMVPGGAAMEFTWTYGDPSTALIFRYRRCVTPLCAGDEMGDARDETPTGVGVHRMLLPPGDYRWTVYYPDGRCPDGRCAAEARVLTVVCPCASGPCCQGCGFRDAAMSCEEREDDERCTTNGSRDAIERRAVSTYCSGASAECNGRVDSTWRRSRTCATGEQCRVRGGRAACEAPSCVPATETCNGRDDDCDGAVDEEGVCTPRCVCASGACCDGCAFLPSSRECASMEVYRCSGAVGGSIERQRLRTLCSGASASCGAAPVPGPWELVRRCGPAERCTGGATAASCVPTTCAPGATGDCMSGRPGVCSAGRQSCSPEGVWGACAALRTPAPEACNGLDDDCDGGVDEDGVCGPRCGDGTCNGSETCGSCAGDCGACPTTCTLTLRETSNWNFEADHFTYTSGPHAIGAEVSFGISVENPSSTRSYEFSRSRVELFSGDSVQLVTSSDYDDTCIAPRNDRYFGGFSLRVLRPGTTALQWGGRYRYYLHSYCSTVEPNSYREDYDQIEFEAVVTCR